MKVALCNTKATERAIFLLQCLGQGIVEYGDSVIMVNDYGPHEKEIGQADVAVQVCTKNKHHSNTGVGLFRRGVLRACQHQRKRLLTIDTAFLSNQSEMEMRVANKKKVDFPKLIDFTSGNVDCYGEYMDTIYYELGYDGIKRNADYCNANSPGDRWDKLGFELKPWRTEGKHILFLGQTIDGASSQNIDLRQWYGITMAEIRKHTDRKVVFRQHPRVKKRPGRVAREQALLPRWLGNPQNVEFSKSWLLADDAVDAKAAVVFSSNAAVWTVVEGIPTFVGDPICMSWGVGNHDLSKLDTPEYPDRLQWAHDLAYAQWNCAEMKSGEAWAHLRPHAKSYS